MPSFKIQSEKVLKLYRRLRRMPSHGEIRDELKYKWRSPSVKLVGKMIKRGLLPKDIKRQHGIKHVANIPVLGTVEAGWASPAEEELLDTISLDDYLIPNKEATYILRVKGDSMIDAGIMPGDQVLVERGGEAKDGDIVIAEVDHNWTMKYFRKRGGKITLVPANKKFLPITPKAELRIAAIVKAVIRKY
jgi:SOS regulatory protein LexA